MEQLSLRERYLILIGFLKEHGYAHSYIRKFETEVRVILRMIETQTWVSYEDLYKQHCDAGYGPQYLRSKKSILGLVAQFDIQGVFPGGPGIFSNFVRQNALETLLSDFKSVILHYKAIEEKRGIGESTITVSSVQCDAKIQKNADACICFFNNYLATYLGCGNQGITFVSLSSFCVASFVGIFLPLGRRH